MTLPSANAEKMARQPCALAAIQMQKSALSVALGAQDRQLIHTKGVEMLYCWQLNGKSRACLQQCGKDSRRKIYWLSSI